MDFRISRRVCSVAVVAAALVFVGAGTGRAAVSVDCVCDGAFFVGQRVRATVDNPAANPDILEGALGTVTGGSPGYPEMLVEWDGLGSGHNGNNNCTCPVGCSATAPMGWFVGCAEIEPVCGNGVVDAFDGEQCDDGNGLDGDCCASSCELPSGCKTAGKSVLVLKNSADDSKDKLIWKWNKGQATTFAQFEEMGSAEDYVACLNTPTSAATLVFGFAWTNDGSKYSYEDATGAPHGVNKAQFKPSDADKVKISVKGSGANLPDLLTGTLGFPVTVRLVRPGHCFESSFGDAKKNDGTTFKAVAAP